MAKTPSKKTPATTRKSASLKQTLELTAKNFITRLKTYQSDVELEKIKRYFKSDEGDYGAGDIFMGVRMGNVFSLAKEFIDMAPDELERLLESDIHEVRAGAMSIMDKQGRNNKTTETRRKELFDLYLKRIDRINNWDLVDLAAPFVIGRYLFDKRRNILHKLAASKNVWERRTAIVSTAYFIRQKDVGDTFTIAELLIHDNHDLVQKAVGGWIREAGKQDPAQLLKLLDKYAASMPRTLLRYAIERLDKKKKEYYMSLKKKS